MKKLLALLLCLVMVLGLGTTAFAADAKSNDIVILHTDDVHCGVTDGMGYAGVAAYKAEMQQTHNYVALVDCGDAIQGETVGTLSAGAYIVDIMNETGYDFAAFGNHEFDYKLPQLAKLTKQAKYEYLACNFKYLGTGTTDITYKPYEIVDYGGTKVAYIGIATPESFSKSTPAYFQDENGNYKINYTANSGSSGAVIFTSCKDVGAAWNFIDWFTTTDVQVEYGKTIEAIMGPMGRYDTANVEALSRLNWSTSEYAKISDQMNNLREVPIIPASYAVTRNVYNAFRAVVNNQKNPRYQLSSYNRDINSEIVRKLKDLGYYNG